MREVPPDCPFLYLPSKVNQSPAYICWSKRSLVNQVVPHTLWSFWRSPLHNRQWITNQSQTLLIPSQPTGVKVVLKGRRKMRKLRRKGGIMLRSPRNVRNTGKISLKCWKLSKTCGMGISGLAKPSLTVLRWHCHISHQYTHSLTAHD